MSGSDEIQVDASVQNNCVEIAASYPTYLLIEAGFDEPFRKQLVEKYEDYATRHKCRDCILSINAEVAGSQVVKGIFELYRIVRSRSGNLICANYPPLYVRALTDLGLPSLPGFELCSSLEESRTRIERARTQSQ